MTRSSAPRLYILAGPNGAGKSTAAPELVGGRLPLDRLVNPDTIARVLEPQSPSVAAFAAGRAALAMRNAFIAERKDFAYETTLSGQVAREMEAALAHGYEIDLWFLFLPWPGDAVARVRERVVSGGHDVPESDVIRRFHRGLVNFEDTGRIVAARWRLIDGWSMSSIAAGTAGELAVAAPPRWDQFQLAVQRAREVLRIQRMPSDSVSSEETKHGRRER